MVAPSVRGSSITARSVRAPFRKICFANRLSGKGWATPNGTGKTPLAIAITASVMRAGSRGRYFNTVDLVTRIEEETRIGKAGSLASQPSRLDLIVPGRAGIPAVRTIRRPALVPSDQQVYQQTSVIPLGSFRSMCGRGQWAASILPDGTRKRAKLFSSFLSHYLI